MRSGGRRRRRRGHAGFFERVDVDAGDEAGDWGQGGGCFFGGGGGDRVRGGQGVGRHVAGRCGSGARVLRVEGGEEVAGGGLVVRVRGVEEGEPRGLQEPRGGFGFVAPVGRRFGEGGFDLGFPALGAVEGDLEGGEAGGVEDVLIRRGVGFGEAFQEGVEDGDCGAVVVGQDVELDDGHDQTDVLWSLLEQRQDLFETELGELALSMGGGVEDGDVVDVW